MKTTSPQAPQELQPLGTKKTLLIMVTVVGCVAILWPKVFYPMITGNPQKPAPLKDYRGPGCCDVVLDSQEFANSSTALANLSLLERKTFRKHLNVYTGEISIRQERPPHLKPDGIHPAMRERGRAVPMMPSIPITGDRPRISQIPPKIVDGKPGPIPGMRPPMGAGSHQQPATRTNSMGLIMPLYTVGIVAFFVYTIMKIICKKSPATPYTEVKPDPQFRQQVFETDQQPYIKRPDDGSTKLAWKDHDANYIYHQPHPLLLNNNPYENGCHHDNFPPPLPPAPLNKVEPPEPNANNSSPSAYTTNQSDDEKRDEKTKPKEVSVPATAVNAKLNQLESEYQVKERKQLLEIESLRKKLEETERAMANIIARMDTIPGQKKLSLPFKE